MTKAQQSSRLTNAIASAQNDGRSALVIYICAGDPDLALTRRLIPALAEAGADIIEVGVPFSDPTADGVAIQHASERALASGTSLARVLETVHAVRQECDVPILLFGYYNPFLAFGEQRLAEAAAKAGVDGLLVVDLPIEESEPLRQHLAEQGLGYVPLLAPTSSASRVQRVSEVPSAFVYYVSMTGVTGAETVDFGDAAKRAQALREKSEAPVCVGFGIKSAEQVRALAPHVDGVVVGSAVVRVIEQAPDRDAAVTAATELVRELAAATVR